MGVLNNISYFDKQVCGPWKLYSIFYRQKWRKVGLEQLTVGLSKCIWQEKVNIFKNSNYLDKQMGKISTKWALNSAKLAYLNVLPDIGQEKENIFKNSNFFDKQVVFFSLKVLHYIL